MQLCCSHQLPDNYSAPWRCVFSTRLHGESFTRMVSGLMKRGPTLLLIRDTKGHVFGGFASHAWEVKPQFQGERSEHDSPIIDILIFMCYAVLNKTAGLQFFQLSKPGTVIRKCTDLYNKDELLSA